MTVVVPAELVSSERMRLLVARLQTDEFDFDAWLALLHEALQLDETTTTTATTATTTATTTTATTTATSANNGKGKKAEEEDDETSSAASESRRRVAEIAEQALRRFPTVTRLWLLYIEFELRHHRTEAVEKLFARSLPLCWNVDLWRAYLNYVRTAKAELAEGSEIVKQAYEYALEHVGVDIYSSSIWTDYVNFLKALETNSTYQEQQKMDAIRKTYQRAVVNPMHGVEELWKQYNAFENGLNKIVAAKMIRERSSMYMATRTALRDRKLLFDAINRNYVPTPLSRNDKYEQQLVTWRKIFALEKDGPEETAIKRTTYAYKQSLMHLRFHPELWIEAASYLESVGKHTEATELYSSGMEALPLCPILHFAFAEFEESQRNYDVAKNTYETLIQNLTAAAAAAASSSSAASAPAPAAATATPTATTATSTPSGGDEEGGVGSKTDPLVTNAYIMYIRFSRRVFGIKEAREVFKRARQSQLCSHHIFVASALLEYHLTKDIQLAFRIFDLGLKSWKSGAYVSHFIDYLTHLNDDQNTRALFERALNLVEPSDAAQIWDQFFEYESNYGDLQSSKSVERRRAESLSQEKYSALDGLLRRYSYMELLPCSHREAYLLSPRMKTADEGFGSASAVPTKGPAIPTVAPPIVIPRVVVPGPDTPSIKQIPSGASLLEPVHRSLFPRPQLDLFVKHPEEADSRSSVSGGRSAAGPTARGSASRAPISEAITYFLSQLPQPKSFLGVAIDVDELMAMITSKPIPPPHHDSEDQAGLKRARKHGEDRDEDGLGAGMNRPPRNDVYRTRRKKQR